METNEHQAATAGNERGFLKLSRTIVVLGIVSLFTDLSSEMIVPIVPLYLQNVIRASATNIGIIEGIAESIASLLRIVAGSLADYFGRPKLLTVIGYGLSSISKPFLAITTTWPQVLVIRFSDRFGKGIRSAPRDVIITESISPELRGRAFGFHRAMDTTGAVLGPLVALLILELVVTNRSASSRGAYAAIFLIAAVPAVIAVVILAVFVPERPRQAMKNIRPEIKWSALSPQIKRFLLVAGIFSIGNSSDAFLIIRSKDLLTQTMNAAHATKMVLLVYVLFNAVSALLSMPAGILSDRVGRRPLVTAGLVIFSITYLGFGLARTSAAIWPLFAVYGIYVGLTAGVFRAYAADLAPRELRGTVIGAYFAIEGIALFPASVIAGLLMDRVSNSAPFIYGAVMAAIAALLLLILLPGGAIPQQQEETVIVESDD